MTQSNLNLSYYQTLVFDCDGVVLNSNKIKTQAFYEATKHLGHESAQALVDYHVQNGGISRYVKFEYFINEILKQALDQTILNDLLNRFSQAVKQGLMTCEVAEGLDQLKAKTPDANWLIVSGGDQTELKQVFTERGLDHYFEGGIFGSPDTKDTILAREIANGTITRPALFLGDSKYDYQAAETAGLDFIFLTQWTEVKDHQAWCQENYLKVYENLKGACL
ncbi:HAD family hydrolase [bacterium]|jgi:phosphoglycolate phosphatase-like HAD superfamily hydrolase|nr:HAD family hydrolase [bacterium]